MRIKSYHDKEIRGIRLLEDDRVWIELGDAGRICAVIEVFGLEKLRINNLQEGNIVARVIVHGSTDALSSPKKIENLVNYLFGFRSDPNSSRNEKEFVRSVLHRVELGELFILEIEPSYGCHFLALWKAIEERPINTAN